MKKLLIIIAVAALALGGGFAARKYLIPAETSNAVLTLPEFSLPDLAGKTHAMSEWQGKIRIINFWATWCPPCLKEIPEFIKLQQQYGNQGMQFIGVAIDDDFAVADFIKTTPINYPNLIGTLNGITLAEQLGNMAGVLPYTLIVGPNGQILHKQHGELVTAKIMEIVTPLLKKPN